jgi:eukaryotic-like serine/threonine-protein kinase
MDKTTLHPTTTPPATESTGTAATGADTLPFEQELTRSAAQLAPPSTHWGLGTRFSLAAAGLLLLTVLAAVLVASWRANRVAERSIRTDLGRAPLVYHTYQTDLEARAREVVRSLAGEPGTIALFDPSVSVQTRHEFVVDDAARVLSARTVFLFDSESRVLARSDRPEGDGVGQPFGAVGWVAEPLETLRETSAVIREGTALSVVGAAPVISGAGDAARLDGVLAASFPVEAAQAEALRGLTRGEVAFLVDRARRGEPAQVTTSVATTGLAGIDVAAAFGRIPQAVTTVFGQGRELGPFELELGGHRRVGLALPIKSAAGETYGAFVVLRSVAEELAAFNQIRTTLLVIGLLAVTLAVPLTFTLGRRMARPLAQLAAGAAGIRDGNLEVSLPAGGQDEVGVLAQAFRAMVAELKEKRDLELMVAALQKPALATAAGGSAAGSPSAGTGGEPRVGELFANRYLVRGTLGVGAMGTVYLVADRQLDEDVALKILHPDTFASEGTTALQNLKSEIRMARQITHPNVVRVHDLGEAGGAFFLTMEHVAGLSLRQVLNRQGAMGIKTGLQIAKQLCRGLGAVHAAGIIHRDIKPHNIMMLPSGVVKLMDFGIARRQEGADPWPDEGSLVGTPAYMSPEQAGGRPMDLRSDIYALGAVLFELFTGRQVFSGQVIEVLNQHITVPPPRPTSIRPELPPALERLILACLAKKPAARPATVQAVYGALLQVTAPA